MKLPPHLFAHPLLHITDEGELVHVEVRALAP